MKLISVVIALWIAMPAAGQSIGANVAGIVVDESGARLQGASVTIAHVQNGRSVTVRRAMKANIVSSRFSPANTISPSPSRASRT